MSKRRLFKPFLSFAMALFLFFSDFSYSFAATSSTSNGFTIEYMYMSIIDTDSSSSYISVASTSYSPAVEYSSATVRYFFRIYNGTAAYYSGVLVPSFTFSGILDSKRGAYVNYSVSDFGFVGDDYGMSVIPNVGTGSLVATGTDNFTFSISPSMQFRFDPSVFVDSGFYASFYIDITFTSFLGTVPGGFSFDSIYTPSVSFVAGSSVNSFSSLPSSSALGKVYSSLISDIGANFTDLQSFLYVRMSAIETGILDQTTELLTGISNQTATLTKNISDQTTSVNAKMDAIWSAQSQQSAQQHDELVNGYDSSGFNDSQTSLDSSFSDYEKGETQLLDSAFTSFDSFTSDYFDTGVISTYAVSILSVSTWYSRLWQAFGDLTVVFTVSLAIGVVALLLKIRAHRGG